MEINKVISLYSNESKLQQVNFLSCLGHQITIFARDSYDPNTDFLSNPAQLRCVNEIMHRLLGQQSKLLLGDQERYPDDVFIKMIFDMASKCAFEHYLSLGVRESIRLCMSKEGSDV